MSSMTAKIVEEDVEFIPVDSRNALDLRDS